MSDKQWVQHISGQGEKHRVSESSGYDNVWRIETAADGADYYLPKSEYRLCDPPTVWKDISGECGVAVCEVTGGLEDIVREIDIVHGGRLIRDGVGYRVRKIQLDREYINEPEWVFIVEQQEHL